MTDDERATTVTGRGQPGWIRRLWSQCRRSPRTLAALALALFGGAMAEVTAPLLTKWAMDSATAGVTDVIGVAAALLALLAVGRFATSYGRRMLAGKLSLDVQHSLRLQLLGSLQRLDGAGQDTLRTGQVVSRSITDLQLVQTLLAMAPLSGMSFLQFFLAAGVMLWLSPPLAAVALLMVPVVVAVVYRMRPRLHAATWSAQQRAAELAEHVEETVTGVRVVKGFGQEARMVDVLERHGRRLFAERMRATGINARFSPTLAAIPQMGLVVVIALGGWLALRGDIGLGTFLAFSAYVTTMTTTARTMASVIILAQLTRAGAERVYQVIDAAPAVADPPRPAPVPDGPLGVELDAVTFGFDPGQPVLHDLDLRVRPGETVAVIGPAGSGKTTLSLLLPRFYTPDAGRIRLLGTTTVPPVDIADVAAEQLRAAVGVVFDDPFLFSASVADNIALGRPEATDSEIRAAARAAAAQDFIEALPDGYDTVVGERGLTLSGGQRQRLALARALLAQPRILVLDDATSAVDAVTEAEIFGALPDRQSRTTIILAHRESTLAHADRVVRLPAPPVAVGSAPTSGSARLPTADPADRMSATTDLSATPELRHRIDRLPAANEDPRLDPARLREPDPGFRLLRLLRPVRLLVLTTVVLLALDALVGLGFPPLVRHAIDVGVAGSDPSALTLAALLGTGLVLIGWVVGAATTLLTARTGERVLYGLRIRSYAHLQRLGLDYYERELSGRIMTRMTTDIDALSTFLQTGVSTALVSTLSLAGIAVALLVIDLRLGLIVLLGVLPPLVVATVIFRRISAVAYSISRERVSTVNADFQENIAGLRAVQANRHERRAAHRFARHSARYRHARMRAQRAIAVYFGFLSAWTDLALALVIATGAYAVAADETSAGTLIAFVLYLGLLFGPVQQLSQVFDGYQRARVGLRRIGELLRTPSSIRPDPADADPIADRLHGALALDSVRFRYPGTERRALDGVDLAVAPGTSLALVGATGAGKSTVVKLLARLYDLGETDSGAVRVDGADIRDYRLDRYRSRLGMVPQEAHLFTGDIASNIAFGKPSATDIEIAEAARAVGAADMIAGLPGGMHRPIGERGRGLSAGQRQLIALARAQLVDPDVLLLDEATATLDPETEEKVLAATGSLALGRTTVVVAHRLATAARTDRIAVVDQGRIVETGTHSELLAAGGHYARLWSAAETAEGILSVVDESSSMRSRYSGGR